MEDDFVVQLIDYYLEQIIKNPPQNIVQSAVNVIDIAIVYYLHVETERNAKINRQLENLATQIAEYEKKIDPVKHLLDELYDRINTPACYLMIFIVSCGISWLCF